MKKEKRRIMGLFPSPVIIKFFSNKIESSRPEWGDYLLEVAGIFSSFDGEDLDRDVLAVRLVRQPGWLSANLRLACKSCKMLAFCRF
jgi:hypothetical protein